MKKVIITSLLMVFCILINAQVPESFNYQAVVRNAAGEPVINQQVSFWFTIYQTSSSGTNVYSEKHSPTTDESGLVTLSIGDGSEKTGDFSAIEWSADNYFLNIKVDPAGGSTYTDMGTTQLLSVPYAMHSKTAETSSDVDRIRTLLYVTADPSRLLDAGVSVTDLIDAGVSVIDLFNAGVGVGTLEQNGATSQELTDAGLIGTLTDVNGNSYKWIKIGDQIWMAENLKTTKYRNEDVIGTTTPATLDISGESVPRYQWAYDGNEDNVAIYGRLYTWHVVTDSRNICPTGWDIPSQTEWTILQDFLITNGFNYDGTTSENKVAKSIASTTLWLSSAVTGAVGNTDYPEKRNTTGFNGLPSGTRYPDGQFLNNIYHETWWSSTEYVSYPSWAYYCQIFFDWVYMEVLSQEKNFGRSVRCIKDE